MRIGSLFAGIGGFDLAAEWVWGKGSTVWHSEIDPYACAVFAQHFPDSRNVGDITTWEPNIERDTVDLICGGFPCQPVSVAGKRLAQDDPRWLWPQFGRVVRILRPQYVVVENVPGLLSSGMGNVLGDLADIGYDAEWTVLSAADVGAPHLRRRVWIVAYPNGGGRRSNSTGGDNANGPDTGRSQADGVPRTVCTTGRAGVMAYSSSHGLEEQWVPAKGRELVGHLAGRSGCCQDAGQIGGWWATEPNVGRVAHGVSSRVDRLSCLGNAIVPQVAEWIFRQIQEAEVKSVLPRTHEET